MLWLWQFEVHRYVMAVVVYVIGEASQLQQGAMV